LAQVETAAVKNGVLPLDCAEQIADARMQQRQHRIARLSFQILKRNRLDRHA
jgi:hypothetical protein